MQALSIPAFTPSARPGPAYRLGNGDVETMRDYDGEELDVIAYRAFIEEHAPRIVSAVHAVLFGAAQLHVWGEADLVAPFVSHSLRALLGDQSEGYDDDHLADAVAGYGNDHVADDFAYAASCIAEDIVQHVSERDAPDGRAVEDVTVEMVPNLTLTLAVFQ